MRRAEYAMTPAEARAFLATQTTFHLATTTPTTARRSCARSTAWSSTTTWSFTARPRARRPPPSAGPRWRSPRSWSRPRRRRSSIPSARVRPRPYYRSVAIHGALEELVDPPRKAAALAALMTALQPDGGYRPITADDPMYRAAVRGLLVAGLRLDRIEGKAKLAQNRRPEEIPALLDKLWDRGQPGDPRARSSSSAPANPDAPPPRLPDRPARRDASRLDARRRRRGARWQRSSTAPTGTSASRARSSPPPTTARPRGSAPAPPTAR
jgi:nitroimidazol reductase NimA-like FMN-containing flavoprotein (pyridoxamine 5'-phosphate oxidase superfamily)